MRGDSAIWHSCMDGRPDWTSLAGKCGCTPDEVRTRAVELGAWWFIGLEPEGIARGDLAIREGKSPMTVAAAMGSDVHAALVLMGLRGAYGWEW